MADLELEDRLLEVSIQSQKAIGDSVLLNAKLKCYELAIEKVKVMNQAGYLSFHAIGDEVTKQYKKILETVGLVVS